MATTWAHTSAQAVAAMRPSLTSCVAAVLIYYVAGLRSGSGKNAQRVSPVVALALAVMGACAGAAVVGACTGWSTTDMQHAAVGAIASYTFLATNSAPWSLMCSALNVVLLAYEAYGQKMDHIPYESIIVASPILVGAVAFDIARFIKGFRAAPVMRAAFVAASVAGAQLLSPVEALRSQAAIVILGSSLFIVLLIGGRTVLTMPTSSLSSSSSGMTWTDTIVTEATVALLALLALCGTGDLAGVRIGALLAVLCGAALMASVRAYPAVFMDAASEAGFGLALQVVLLAWTGFTAAMGHGSAAAIPSAFLARALCMYALGYTSATLSVSLQSVLLEPLQLYAAAATRASSVDYAAMEALILGAAVVIGSRSTRPALAWEWMRGQWVTGGGEALASHPLLAPLGIHAWTPSMQYALCTAALAAVSALLQTGLACTTPMLAPLVAEVTARGSPRLNKALSLTLNGIPHSYNEAIAVLRVSGARCTVFVGRAEVSTEAGEVAVRLLLKEGHEIGLLGEEGESSEGIRDRVRALQGMGVGMDSVAPTTVPPPSPSRSRARGGSASASARTSAMPALSGPGAASVAGRAKVVDTAALMYGQGGANTRQGQGVVWYRPAQGTRDLSTLCMAGGAGLSIALWSACVTAGGTEAEDVDAVRLSLKAQLQGLPAEAGSLAAILADRTGGAVVCIQGERTRTASTLRCVLSALSSLGVPNGGVMSLSGLCPDGGRINEVLRVGGL